MKKQDFEAALKKGSYLHYKPKGTFYLLNNFVEIIYDNGSISTGLWYTSEENDSYVRPISGFDKFELIHKEAPFEKATFDRKRIMESARYDFPHEYLGEVKIKNLHGTWDDGVLFACSMGKIYCCNTDYLSNYTIDFVEKPKINNSVSDHFQELQQEPHLKLWNGDMTNIPEKNTLLSFQTASHGWVNGVVSGYQITWYKNKPQIRVKLRYINSDANNERFIEELGLPLSTREKELISENLKLKIELNKLKETEDDA